MELTFWGSRGSSPVVMNHHKLLALLDKLVTAAKAQGVGTLDELVTAAKAGQLGMPLHYGGHTPCTEVAHGEQRFLVDMGSGLREAGTRYFGKQKEFVFFLTHMHWDHLIGLNFFPPIFVPGHKLVIHHVHRNAPDHVRIMFNGTNFPVKWDQLGAQIEFRQLKMYEPVTTYPGVTVTPFALDHPGGSFGYRFDGGGKSVAIGVDGEFTRVSRDELGKDLPYYQNLDLLVFDAQYELEELLNKHDWGHSSAPIGIDLALREGIKTLVLMHHDPWASDERLAQSKTQAQKYIDMAIKRHADQWQANPGGPKLISAYDGLTIKV